MLLNYEPFADAARLLDRVAGSGQAGMPRGMAMDVQRLDDHLIATFDLPGVDPGSIDVTVEGNSLTVRAERSAPHEDGEWLCRERPRGGYSRRLMLGRDLDGERLTAAYHDGVLSITIPVAERAKPRRVAVTRVTDGTTSAAVTDHGPQRSLDMSATPS
ncbi:18 kDa antigen 1 [Pseudonocardia sp. N23]|nr:18 kDa antigen 1 [Pseudonocardia sp. N23]